MFGDLLCLLLANARAAGLAASQPRTSTGRAAVAAADDQATTEVTGKPATAAAPAEAPAPVRHLPVDVPAALKGLCTSFSDGKLDLSHVLRTFSTVPPDVAAGRGRDPAAEDAPAFHGPQAVFSVR